MLKLAVFGHPVVHSLSPRIHGMFAEAAGIELEYDRIDCPAGELAGKLRDFRRAGGQGCNLTVPLKAEGLALAAHASRAAQQADACNTLVAADDGWHADNTDGAGLVADLDRLGMDIANRNVLVLGAGGAVAGILGPMLDRGPARICLVNRDVSRAERLAPVSPGTAGRFRRTVTIRFRPEFRSTCCFRAPASATGAPARRCSRNGYSPALSATTSTTARPSRPFAARCGELGIACHTRGSACSSSRPRLHSNCSPACGPTPARFTRLWRSGIR